MIYFPHYQLHFYHLQALFFPITLRKHLVGGLKEFVKFLDGTRESILNDVIYFDGEKDGVPRKDKKSN